MRKLMWFTIGYAIACAYGTWAARGSGLLLAGAVCLMLSAALWRFREHPAVKRGMVLALGGAFGCLAFFGYAVFVLGPAAAMDGVEAEVSIRVTDYSWQTDYGVAADGELELSDRRYKVRFYVNEDQNLEPGDLVRMKAELRLTDEGGSREPTYHRTSGILLLAYPRGEPELTAGEPDWRDLPARWARRLKGILDDAFPADSAPFAKALLLGDKSDISWDQSRAFSRSGISHIVAVSGLHVGILFALVGVVTGKRRFWMVLAGIPSLLLFAAMAGFTASVTRAVIMQLLFLLALALNREYDPPTALSFAVLLMLLHCPLTIAGIGFQLSVASVAGIFLFYEKLDGWLKNWLPGKGKTLRGRLERFFTASVSVTLSATVMTVPLTAIHFGLVSLVGVVTNLLVLPLVSCIFYGIMAVCALGCVHMGAAGAAAWVIAWPIRYVLAVARTLGELPLAAVYTVSPYVVLWLVFLYGLIGWLLATKRKRPGLAVCLGALGLCVSLMLSFLEPLACDYRVTVLDVGQGQCILLQSAGNTFMVDCGGRRGEEAADIAAEQLLSQGITRIDGLILTHYDRDHAGGVQFLAEQITIERVYLPRTEDTDGCLQSVLNSCAEQIDIDTDMTISFGDAKNQIFPPKDAGSGNDSCAAVLFQRGKCDTLITGDMSAAAERQLLSDYDLPDLEVLIVGHHGSKYSTCEELLEATAPDAAIISVGAENGYGHPTAEVLQRLEQAGCAVYRTDLHGTITYRG
ncbi:MAG: DNA internalization-related competence protein ComEC/Rec2 [Oscillospiraceae bacterium]|nr:DNA internalization-related competence protein ComEC/Rec2 [Oscillospiraceae bacterium]